MREEQEKLRVKVKELKWKYNVSYKELSELLDMNYNSFVNFVNGYKELGYGRSVKLKAIIKERSI